jgi:hypothetical protein
VGERKVLVIGSQCARESPLSFLPELAHELYQVLTDAELGQCTPALDGLDGPLLDPTVDEAWNAVTKAYKAAARDGDTLVLGFIGHGECAGDNFFLLPRDAGEERTSRTALHLAQLVNELYHAHGSPDGLVVLVDACFAGGAAVGAADRWGAALGGRFRYELLAGTDDRPAYNGCFTRTVLATLRAGVKDELGGYVRAEHCIGPVGHECRQTPQFCVFRSGGEDTGLWLARNAAYQSLPRGLRVAGVAELVKNLTARYQPPPQLAEVVAASREFQCVAVTGGVGAGKSALAAALARPAAAGGAVPEGFAQAVLFVSPGLTSGALADRLANQLADIFTGFAEAQRIYQHRVLVAEWKSLTSFQRWVIGPLRLLREKQKQLPLLRLVIDGLDQAGQAQAARLTKGMDELADDPDLKFVRLVVTARPDTRLPAGAYVVKLRRAESAELRTYFTSPRLLSDQWLPSELLDRAVARAQGIWLVARLLAEQYRQEPAAFDPAAVPPGLAGAYERNLARLAGEPASDRWRRRLRPVLGALAAAGSGPVMPLELLVEASRALGGPGTKTALRDALVDLRGLVVRADPGTAEEQAGLFHETLSEYLLDPASRYGQDAGEAHQAVLKAIEQLAPIDRHNIASPGRVGRYAMAREAEHLWRVGRVTDLAQRLRVRQSTVPRENLEQHLRWLPRLAGQLGLDHPDTLTLRHNLAHWTGKAGDAAGALRLYRELLPDRERALGPGHPDTLTTRSSIAHWTGRAGDAMGALRLFEALRADRERALGKEDRFTLATRHNLAHWTGEAGDAMGALRLYRELLPDRERALGPDHPDTLATRQNIAYLAGQAGDGGGGPFFKGLS